jgi:hypothetical protein
LKPNPAITATAPTAATDLRSGGRWASPTATRSRCIAPVTPYTRLIPNSVTADDTTETRKSLSAASLATPSDLRRATSANTGSDSVSSATTRVIRSRPAASSSAPVRAASSKKWYSPAGSADRRISSCDSSTTTSAASSTIAWKSVAKSSAT